MFCNHHYLCRLVPLLRHNATSVYFHLVPLHSLGVIPSVSFFRKRAQVVAMYARVILGGLVQTVMLTLMNATLTLAKMEELAMYVDY